MQEGVGFTQRLIMDMDADLVKAIVKAGEIEDAMTEVVKTQSKPNYYAIMPSPIRYDNNLSHLEKILYAEISALSNKYGYCYASNAWFAQNFGNSTRTISRSINRLAEKGYVSIQCEVSSDSTIRKIYMTPQTKVSTPPRQKCLPNSIKENSTSIYNTNTPSVKNPTPVQPPMQLPDWLGKNAYARVVMLYELLWENKFGAPHSVKASSPGSAVVSRLVKEHGEILSALIIILHFEWKGMNGDDDTILKNLRAKAFPLNWIPYNVASYIAFIRNTLGITDDRDAIDRIDEVLGEITTPEQFALHS